MSINRGSVPPAASATASKAASVTCAERVGWTVVNDGLPGLERWVGWGIITNNLAVIAMKLNQRHVSLAEALA